MQSSSFTWDDEFNNFTKYVIHAYGIKSPDEPPIAFSRTLLLRGWNCYIWLQQQLDENDETKLSHIRDFLNNPEYHHFIVGFIHSGFIPDKTCRLYGFFDSTFFNNARMSIAHPFATEHPHERQKNTYNKKFNERLEIMKNDVLRFNEKYDGINKIKWSERVKVSKCFIYYNEAFHRCGGTMRFARARQRWVEFNKTEEVEQFFRRIRTNNSPPTYMRTDKVIRYLTAKISKNDKNDNKTIMERISHYSNLYRTNTGQMSCKTSRKKWKAFYDLHKHKYCYTYKRYQLRQENTYKKLDDEDDVYIDDENFNKYVDEFYEDTNDTN